MTQNQKEQEIYRTIEMTLSLTPSSQRAVRLDFNPSGIGLVTRIKQIAAAFITECESLRETANGNVEQGRAASLAITDMEAASMWAVKSATVS